MPSPYVLGAPSLRQIAHALITPAALPMAPTNLTVTGGIPLGTRFVTNLLTPDLGEKWRQQNSNIGLPDPTIVARVRVQFPSPVTINTIALCGTNADAATRVRVVGSDDPFFVTVGFETCPDTARLAHWPQPDLGNWTETLYLRWLEQAETWPNWMVEIEFSHAYYQAGRLIIGYGYQPTIDVQDGHGIVWEDPSPVQTTVVNKEYIDKRPRKRRWSGSIKIPDEHEAYGDVFRMERVFGGTEPMLFSLDPHPENPYLHDQCYYARMSDLSPMTNANVSIWDKQFTFKELL